MGNNELQKIWRKGSNTLNMKSEKELEKVLQKKVKKTMGNYYYHIGFSVLVSTAFIIFLLIAAYNRKEDMPYIINNFVICIITVFALVSSLWSWYRLGNNKFHLPLKEWLAERIGILSKWLSNKLPYFLGPLLALPTLLSIHVYWERKSFIDVLSNEESIYGLIFGYVAGCLVALFALKKIRKSHFKNLEHLKDLFAKLK